MKLKILTLIGLLCAPAAAQTEPASAPATGAPQAYVEQPNVDLGEIREGTVASATFVLENRGQLDLVIQNIQASCGCTTVQLAEAERTIKPGGKQEIVAKFDSKDRLGEQHKTVTVTLNDPRQPQLTLTFTANVVTLLQVLPAPIIQLRGVQRGSVLAPIDVYPQHKEDRFEKLELEIPNHLLDFRQEPVEDPEHGRGVRFYFQVPDEIDLGNVNGEIKFHATVGGQEATLAVRVAGQVTGDIIARPGALQALAPAPRGLNFPQVVIASTTDRPFQIIGLSAGPYVDVSVQPLRPNKEYSIRGVIRDDAPDGPFGAELLVRTDNPSQPLVRVPIFANVRARYLLEPDIAVLEKPDANRRVRIRAEPTHLLKIFGVRSEHPAIAAEITTDPAEQRPNLGYVNIRLSAAAAAEGAFNTGVVVQTNIPGAAEVRIPVEYRPAQ